MQANKFSERQRQPSFDLLKSLSEKWKLRKLKFDRREEIVKSELVEMIDVFFISEIESDSNTDSSSIFTFMRWCDVSHPDSTTKLLSRILNYNHFFLQQCLFTLNAHVEEPNESEFEKISISFFSFFHFSPSPLRLMNCWEFSSQRQRSSISSWISNLTVYVFTGALWFKVFVFGNWLCVPRFLFSSASSVQLKSTESSVTSTLQFFMLCVGGTKQNKAAKIEIQLMWFVKE